MKSDISVKNIVFLVLYFCTIISLGREFYKALASVGIYFYTVISLGLTNNCTVVEGLVCPINPQSYVLLH